MPFLMIEVNEMKALSLTQPYAELMKKGIKTIDTRSWKTNYRGPVYIHASATAIPKTSRDNVDLMTLISGKTLDYGCIICSCELVDCIKMTEEYVDEIRIYHYKEYLSGVYAPGRYAWVFKNIQILEQPIPVKGHLGLWDFELS